MKDKSVLLLGSYGQTNLGDDLLMWNYLSFLRDQGFRRIYVNASTAKNIPDVVKHEFTDLQIKLTYETSLLGWVEVIRKVSRVVYGGGTVYKELYSSTGRSKYSVIFRIMMFNLLARLLGAKIYHLHIGIGVLRTGLGRAITRLALKTAKLSIFRDGQSYMFAKEKLGLPVEKLCLSTDGLFINDVWQKPWHKADFELPVGKYKRVVGVNLLSDIPDWVNREAYLMAVRQFVAKLLNNGDLVLLLPFQHEFNPNNDHDFMRRELSSHLIEHKNLKLVESIPIDQAVSVFKMLDVFVGMRFHSLLLATATATPFVGIAYDTKCTRFLKENNYKYTVRLEDITEASLERTYNALLNNLKGVPEELRKITAVHLKEGKECLKNLDF